MSKTKLITIRVDEATKARIEEAARNKGQSLTTFIVEAALDAVSRQEPEPPRPRSLGGVPMFFRMACLEASRGGASNYADAGWHLAIHLDSLEPQDLLRDEWDEAF